MTTFWTHFDQKMTTFWTHFDPFWDPYGTLWDPYVGGVPVHPLEGQKPQKGGISSPGGGLYGGFGQAGGLAKTGI